MGAQVGGLEVHHLPGRQESCHKILAEYSTSGTFSSTDLLDSLDASIVVSDRLTFLGKYREFLKLVEG